MNMPRVAEATYDRSETRNEIGVVTVLGKHSGEKAQIWDSIFP